ncbi:MAG: lamin tail domain-containing protein [Bacteroidales bacterium]
MNFEKINMQRMCRAGLMLVWVIGMLGWNSLQAQLADDFSSGMFSTQGWRGDTTHFRFTSSSAVPPAQHPAIQLYTSGTVTSAIHASAPWSAMLEWSAWVKLSFNPSASNFARFYLTPGKGFPADPDQCLFVGIGMVNDRIGLYQHDGGQFVTLIQDTLNLMNQSTNQVRVRVKMKNHWWYLETDHTGGDNFITVDSVFLQLAPDSALAGIFCQYTSSNATKFYFDDIYCGMLWIDTVPPALLSAIARDQYQADLWFSEALNEIVMKDPGCFEADHQVGNPLLIFADPTDPTRIRLVFGNPFPDGVPCIISIKSVSDKSGNIMRDTVAEILWYNAMRNDVLITEVMADPSPPVRLPESEYIELYNNTDLAISLCDWFLWIDATRIPLPCMTLNSKTHLILVNEKDTSLWQGYTTLLGLPKLTLKNDGACLAIQNHLGALVHSVCYQSGWHATTLHGEGGYALELRDLLNPCDQRETWTTSTDISGGTPGQSNSPFPSFPDMKAPIPLKVSVPDNQTVMLTFSEPIDTIRPMTTLFAIEGMADPWASFELIAPLYQNVYFTLKQPILPDTVYFLVQSDTLADCTGNYSLNNRLPFGIPTLPDSLDVIFNEIMYKPDDNGAEYIEVYNRSGKIIDLSGCLLARTNTVNFIFSDLYPLTDESSLLFPGGYAVVTRDVQRLLSRHMHADPGSVFLASSLPSLPDLGATYAIVGQHGRIIDLLQYSDDWHAPSLADTRGIALERLSSDMPALRKENWFSAAAGSGWGTPTHPNSQSPPGAAGNIRITVDPPWFSPSGLQGSQLTYLHIQQIEPGSLLSVCVFDEAGRPVRHLVREAVAGKTEMWPWDGYSDLGKICPGGVYVVQVTIFQMPGHHSRFRVPVVLISE